MKQGKVGESRRDAVLWLIGITVFVKLILAATLELANDEVYYWTYALYPDASHFDHPPMVGWLIQLTTFNLAFSDDFFLRLGPILLGAINTWMVYQLGKNKNGEQTGFIASLLFTSSFYCSLLAGFAIIPDAPLIFFWLASIALLLKAFGNGTPTKSSRLFLLAFGVMVGLAMLSKYQGAFLWVSAGLYVIFYNRAWLKEPALYGAGVLSLMVFSPVIIWNANHEFISFTFHSGRVTPSLQPRLDYFARELSGQLAYNNPITVVLVIIALIAALRQRTAMNSNQRLYLSTVIPVYLVFTSFSLFRATLPHWSAPAYVSLILFAAPYWAHRSVATIIPIPLRWSIGLLIAGLGIAFYLVTLAPFRWGDTKQETTIGHGDFTQDMSGWVQIADQFKYVAELEETSGRMETNADLISFRWFPGAHEDYYMAVPLKKKLLIWGDLNDSHKYYWINKKRGDLRTGHDYYYVAVSNYYRDPYTLFGSAFEKIEPLDTIQVRRGDIVMRQAFVYKLQHYNGKR